MLSPSLSCFVVFSVLKHSLCSYLIFAVIQFYLVVNQNRKISSWAGSFFYRISLSLIVWLILRNPFIPQNHREVCAFYFLEPIPDCAHTICSYSQIKLLANSNRVTMLTKSFLVLYCFCTYLQYSLIMWFIVSSLSSHNVLLLCCCVLSILAVALFLWGCCCY